MDLQNGQKKCPKSKNLFPIWVKNSTRIRKERIIYIILKQLKEKNELLMVGYRLKIISQNHMFTPFTKFIDIIYDITNKIYIFIIIKHP
jgi:hypothetical protein